MCFSSTASFSVAAGTAVIGIAALPHVRDPREIFVAIVPLLFAVQQVMEGVLWLELVGGGDADNIASLSFAFLVFAKVLWPVYVPIAVHLIEPDHLRRLLLRVIVILGAVLSLGLLADLLSEPQSAAIRAHSISYSSDVSPSSWLVVPYLVCTCVALLLSSHGAIRIFGGIVVVGFLVSSYVYFATYISVWCFFAAAGSVVLYFALKHASVNVGIGRA